MRLNAEKAYFIDESSMKLMDIFMKDAIKCRLCSEECPTRVSLWTHMRETCSKRTVKCTYCNTWAEPNDLLRHFQLGRCMSYKRHDEHLRRSTAPPAPAAVASAPRTRPSETDEDSSDISSSDDEAEGRQVISRLQEASLRRLRAEERETELRQQERLRRMEMDAHNRRVEEEESEIPIDSDARTHALLRRRREADNRRAEEEERLRADAEEHMDLQLQHEVIW